MAGEDGRLVKKERIEDRRMMALPNMLRNREESRVSGIYFENANKTVAYCARYLIDISCKKAPRLTKV